MSFIKSSQPPGNTDAQPYVNQAAVYMQRVGLVLDPGFI
jgi:hypothetical protein